MIFNNVTHNTHQPSPFGTQIPMASLHSAETPTTMSSPSAGRRLRYCGDSRGLHGRHPALLRGAFLTKMEITKIHINYPGQYAALVAMQEMDLLRRPAPKECRNYTDIEETVAGRRCRNPGQARLRFLHDELTSGAGATAQEMVGPPKEEIAAIPSDGLGDVKAADYLRLDSHPDIACFERFREALPKAIEEAQAGLDADAVIGFFARSGTERGKAIIDKIRSLQPLVTAAD